jgi:hypothetical protein
MAILKFGFKKSVTEKRIGYYVVAWLIGLLIFLIALVVIDEIPFDTDIAIGIGVDLFVLAIVFLILDGIAWYIGKKIYKKTRKK